jgi:hypothetical protein
VPSVSPPITRGAVLATCAALAVGVASGCSTTQEKAEKQQAESRRILDQREKRQQRKKQEKSNQDGSKKSQ